MLLDIPDTLQINAHVLTGRVAGLSRKTNMDICSNPNGSGVNHVALDLTLFLCACYDADMLPAYPYATCRLNIVSTLADTVFGHVADMSADMSATCRADTHVSVNSTIFSTFKNPTIPAKPKGRGLISPCNWVMRNCPQVIHLHQNCALNKAICDIRVMLQNSVSNPTHCKDLVASWLDYIIIVDASSHGVGGVVAGELSELLLTVFRLQWPPKITNALVMFENPWGKINNTDLEMAGLLLLVCKFPGTATFLRESLNFFQKNS
jgi:hypothetical protein